MKKIIFSLFTVLFSICINAQSPVYTQNTSGPNSCDGSAFLIDSTQMQQTWDWYYSSPDSNAVIIQSGGYLSNLCAGTYSVVVYANGTSTTYTFVIESGTGSDCSTFGAYITVNQSASSPTSNDGSLSVIAYGGTTPYMYTWSNGVSTSTIDGLSPGTYQACVTDANGCYTCANGYVYVDTINGPCSGFYASVTTTNTSSSFMCDGTATVTPYGGLAPYSFEYNNTISNSGELMDLCSGGYYVIVNDAQGCFFTSQFYVGSNVDSTNFALSAYAYTTNVSVEGVCDGTVYIDVYGGTSPYTYVNSNGMVTGAYETGLCEGVYSSIVTDAAGNAFTVNYFIASPDNVIDNGGYPDSTIVDTLSNGVLENCILDYLTLDSAYISDISFVSFDSIVVTWTFLDANGSYDVIESYSLDNGFGVYELIIQIFCPQRAENKYVIVKQNVLLNGAQNSISETNETPISVYPNPVQSMLNISLEGADETLVSVVDITGKIVYEQVHAGDLIQVDFSPLSKGQYILNVSGKNHQFNRLIVK